MDDRIKDVKPRARSRLAAAAVRAVPPGLFLLAGLAVTVLGFSRFVDAHDTAVAYRSAPVCGSAAHTPGTDCVRHETGRVTARDTRTGEDTTYLVKVARETAPEQRYEVDWDFYSATEVGMDVDLTVFRGRVAEVSFQGHRATNPGTPWLSALTVALLAGSGAALTITGLTWSRTGGRPTAFAAVMGGLTSALALPGCLVLMTAQRPLPALLAVPAIGWLAATALGAVILRDS
ncbi:hypothetical protein [Kitasatospora sp. NPDC015120]|uniref:hypothetical protein n=1 Tax=Kitasatospora sp. NPDC015120 TaxID=3364023 RepID=UPI0036F4964D